MRANGSRSSETGARRLEPKHAVHIVAVGAMAFVILFGYAIARPAAESLFLQAYGSQALPRAWIAVALAMVPAVGAYNAAAARWSLGAVMLGAIAASASLLLLLLRLRHPWATLALYVWKDVHVVVLLECLWSFANVVFTTARARWSYGLFCAAGSLGGISGNLAVGWIAQASGTGSALWLLLPWFGVEALASAWVARATGRPRPVMSERGGLRDAWHLLRSSAYLPHLLALVGIVQLVVTLVDYQYNAVIESAYPSVDARTAVIGRVYAIIDGASLALQLGTGLVLRAAGVGATLLGIPLVLGAALGWFVLVPAFLSSAAVKISSKVLDYSLFRAAKEILYIPLSYADKTRGKALVDMLTYRVSKGGASLLLVALLGAGTRAVTLAIAVLLAAWTVTTVRVLRRYRRLGGDA